MSVTQRIIKNTLVLFGSHILTKLLNFALLIILTRMLGSSGFGLYSFALAYVMLFMLLTHLGVNTLLVREIAKNKTAAPDMIGATVPMVALFSGFTLILLNGIAWAAQWPQQDRLVIFIFGIYLFFDSWSRYLISVYRAYERMEFEALVNVSEKTGLLLVAIFTWLSGADMLWLFWAFAAVQFFKASFAFYLAKKFFLAFPIKWNFERVKVILRESYPFALSGIFFTISSRIDIVMLKFFYSDSAAGIYSVARRLINTLIFIPENVAYALFPALSILYVSRKLQFEKTFQRSFHYLTIIAIPLVAGLFILAPQIISLLFEPEFARASIALRLLTVSLAIMFVNYGFVATLSSIGKQHLVSLYMGIAMIINVALNYLLIPKYEILGACYATIISDLVTVLLVLFSMRKILQLPKFSFEGLRVLLAGAGIFILIYFMRHWHLAMVIGLSAVVYLLLLFILKIVSREDIKIVQQFFRDRIPVKENDGVAD